MNKIREALDLLQSHVEPDDGDGYWYINGWEFNNATQARAYLDQLMKESKDGKVKQQSPE